VPGRGHARQRSAGRCCFLLCWKYVDGGAVAWCWRRALLSDERGLWFDLAEDAQERSVILGRPESQRIHATRLLCVDDPEA
jgi:hypothetical protein